MNDLTAFGIQIGILLPLVVVAGLVTRSVRWIYLAAALAYMFVDFCLTDYVPEIPWLDFKALHWNWVGKGASVLFAVAVLVRWPDLKRDSGVVVRQNKGSIGISLACVALLAAAGIYFGFINHREPFNLETLLFQLTMPSLSEELVYRGIMYCLLNRALGIFCQVRGTPIGWAVPIIILWFGLGHATYWDGHAVQVDWLSFAIAGSIGAVHMFVRIISGSLIFPIIGHSAFNFAVSFVKMVR